MTQFLDQLNLRPNERRVVVVVGLVLFIMLNLWLVRPRFHDWGMYKGELQKSRSIFQTFQKDRDNPGVLIFEKELGEVAQIQIHLIAVADHVAEALIRLHGAMTDDTEQSAAVRRDRHRSRLDRQSVRMIVTAGNVFVDVECAVTVWTTNPNIIALGDFAHLVLPPLPFGAVFAETGGADDRGLDAFFAALFHDRRREPGVDHENRHVRRLG